MKKLALIGLLALVSSCSGTLYTVVNPNIPSDKEAKIKGVMFYNTINVIELYETSVLVDKESGNQLGTAPNMCKPDRQIKFSTRTDYDNPSLIVYEPGLLETNKFGITLDKGALSAVNTESNPSAALEGIAAVLPFIKAPETTSESFADGGLPLCNASPKLIGVFHAPDIQPFEAMNN